MTPGISADHTCILERSYHDGWIWQCPCGAFWSRVVGEQLAYAFVHSELHHRLRDYQRGIRYGDFTSLADAVRRSAAEARERRDKEREHARQDWPLRQKAKRAKWLRTVRAILLGRPCAYCGGEATQIDHVIPRVRGGTDAMRNLAGACGRCNVEKGNRTPEEWQAWRLARGRCWPPVPLTGETVAARDVRRVETVIEMRAVERAHDSRRSR